MIAWQERRQENRGTTRLSGIWASREFHNAAFPPKLSRDESERLAQEAPNEAMSSPSNPSDTNEIKNNTEVIL